jgi:hypothetical protein
MPWFYLTDLEFDVSHATRMRRLHGCPAVGSILRIQRVRLRFRRRSLLQRLIVGGQGGVAVLVRLSDCGHDGLLNMRR